MRKKRISKKAVSLFGFFLLLAIAVFIYQPISDQEASFFHNGLATDTANHSSILNKDQKPNASDEVISGDLQVHFLDVGQGDAIYIELPNGQNMLIDAGSAGTEEKIVAYISQLGYDAIDYLVATHPHEDHIGGMTKVIGSFKIKSFYMPKTDAATRTYEELLQAIRAKGLKIKAAEAGVKIMDTANLDIDIISPSRESYNDLNNYSAVIKITYGEIAFLFMGDAEAQAEEAITADVKADVLKVGHHGSGYSTGEDFLSRVAPLYAVISVGADNDYGHPAGVTLEKLAKAGATIYRTDQDGIIAMVSDGTKVSVSTDGKNQF